MCPQWPVVRDAFPFTTPGIEGSYDVNILRVSGVKYVVNPRAIIEFMTSCEERYTEKIRDETRAVDQKAIVASGCNGTLTSSFF